VTLRRRPTTGSIGELGVKELANCHGQRFEPTNDSIAPLPTIAGTIVLLGWLKILEELGLSLPIAFFVSGVLDFIVTYWIPPRPRASFPRYALLAVLTWLGFVLAFWSIPAVLRRLMPVELAYAIPAFFYTICFYGIPIFLWGKRWRRKRTELEISFVHWVIGCAVFSLIVGGVVMILKVVGRHN